ncbi:NAD(P)H-dependent oxidoreductase [Paenibacillus sp. HN-1]|uniref:NAD(P)H-dependent oxidoreductase n=1 Tax=Paenibacillus TaxID=44249 RepID=UPI001CAA282F|nr:MULTISPECIES: NAD(P)H-dependent oxidoreductase [Paenibacillus]MBY9077882.1 NAD(P)H-dependent oxidoreductase [Paenibacillus sp. CGMCC 1.18879]MBY9088162.1 NAD(P)H-dependent oxidoreductase [Paenibacillus sinensis]
MNTLIVYAHPSRESLNGAFLEAVLQGIQKSGGTGGAEVLDLYAEGFNPALVYNKERRRRDMHLDPELEKYREQITRADRIVFIYPIFWGRPPAMLLGYIDRMFAANFAYRSRPNRAQPEGLLKGKSAVCISTMKGPAHYPLLLLNNAHKVLMKRGLFHYVGIRKVKFFEFGSMEGANSGQAKKLAKVERFFAKS